MERGLGSPSEMSLVQPNEKDARNKLGTHPSAHRAILLAAIFLIAGYAKVSHSFRCRWSVASVRTSLSMFAMQVDSYQMLPPSGVNAIAHCAAVL